MNTYIHTYIHTYVRIYIYIYIYWVVEGSLAPIWRAQSGQSGKTCNLAQSGSLALFAIWPVWQMLQSGNLVIA